MTATEIASETGLPRRTIQRRLQRTRDPERVLAPRRRNLLYRLDDGRDVTLAQIRDSAGITKQSALRRLYKSRDPNVVLAPCPEPSSQQAVILSDGTTGTPQDLADRAGLPYELVRNRLRKTRDARRVLSPKSLPHSISALKKWRSPRSSGGTSLPRRVWGVPWID